MKGRTVTFLLIATIVFYFGIFCFATPASAHSIDACISLLQNAAQEATSSSGVSQSQLRDDPEQAAHEKDCDEALKNAGLITLTQVRENRDIANSVLNGDIAQVDLDEKAVQRSKDELRQREQELLKLRLQICSKADPKTAYACPQEEKVGLRAGVQQRAAADANSPSVIGKWEGPYDWPLVPIHVSVGPNGKVLAWQRPKLDAPNIPQYTVWDSPTNKFTSSPPFGKLGAILTDIFCAGHAFAPSGRLLVAGGHATNIDGTGSTGKGSADTNVFDFTTNKWITNLPKMNAGRWYPTVTYLPNGEAVVVSGSKDDEKNLNTLPQVWNGSWRDLTNAQNVTPPLYPWMYVAPNGKVFSAGPEPTTRYLDTAGTGSWSTVATSKSGFRYYGTSVMYDNGKVLIAGGSNKSYTAPTETAEAIDLNMPNPTWLPVGNMKFARKHPTTTLLPDGQVLVTGGTNAKSFNKASGKVLPAEIWNPTTTLWSTMASMTVPRLYHSFAALLPDGRVLVGGGGLPKGDGEIPEPKITISFCLDKNQPKTEEEQKLCKLLINDGHRDVEIYSPPYLFNPDGSLATRPAIASAPTKVSYGQTFTVQTLDAANITPDEPNDKVTWIRLPSVTHSFNANQRINRLSFTQTANGLNVTAPSDKNLCPPGHYMLFILNNGVPSAAKIIQII